MQNFTSIINNKAFTEERNFEENNASLKGTCQRTLGHLLSASVIVGFWVGAELYFITGRIFASIYLRAWNGNCLLKQQLNDTRNFHSNSENQSWTVKIKIFLIQENSFSTRNTFLLGYFNGNFVQERLAGWGFFSNMEVKIFLFNSQKKYSLYKENCIWI